MCSYLHKAPNGVYYFRMTVPADLRPFMGGRREIKKSLGLKDRDAAKLAIPDHAKAAQLLPDQARRGRAAANAPPPNPLPSKSPAQLEREWARWEHEQAQAELVAQATDDWESEIEELEPIMDALAAGQEVDAPPADIARAAYLMIVHERDMANIGRMGLISRISSAHSVSRASENQNQTVECNGDAVSEPNGIYLDTNIVDGWAAERQPSAKGKAAYESSARLRLPRCGKAAGQNSSPFRCRRSKSLERPGNVG